MDLHNCTFYKRDNDDTFPFEILFPTAVDPIRPLGLHTDLFVITIISHTEEDFCVPAGIYFIFKETH